MSRSHVLLFLSSAAVFSCPTSQTLPVLRKLVINRWRPLAFSSRRCAFLLITVSQCYAKKFAGKNVSETTYFASSGTKNFGLESLVLGPVLGLESLVFAGSSVKPELSQSISLRSFDVAIISIMADGCPSSSSKSRPSITV